MRHIFDLKPIVHNLIILELTLKTLEYDKARLEGLKMAPVIEEWYEIKSREVFEAIQAVKRGDPPLQLLKFSIAQLVSRGNEATAGDAV